MAINWEDIERAGSGIGSDLLDILKPYLPALSRAAPDVYEGFIKNLHNADFEAIDTLLYGAMTDEERKLLEDEVFTGLYNATLAKYQRKELLKDISTKILVNLLIKAATAGIL